MGYTYKLIDTGYEIYDPNGVKIIHQPHSPNNGHGPLPSGKAEQLAKLICLKLDFGLDGLVEFDEEFTLERPISEVRLHELVTAYYEKVEKRRTPDAPPVDSASVPPDVPIDPNPAK